MRRSRWARYGLISLFIGAAAAAVGWSLVADNKPPVAVAVGVVAALLTMFVPPLVGRVWESLHGERQKATSPRSARHSSIEPQYRTAAAPGQASDQHVFLCYSHLDASDYADGLATFLAKAGIDAWHDVAIRGGERWTQLIQSKLESSVAVIVVMTSRGASSRWVENEINLAIELGIPIYPMLLSGRRYFSLSHLQYDNVTGGQMPPSSLIDRLHALLDEGGQDSHHTEARIANDSATPVANGERPYSYPMFLPTPDEPDLHRRKPYVAKSFLATAAFCTWIIAVVVFTASGEAVNPPPTHVKPTTAASTGSGVLTSRTVVGATRTFSTHVDFISSIVAVPHGSSVAVSAGFDQVMFWDFSDASRPSRVGTLHVDTVSNTALPVEGIAFDRSGYLMTTDADGPLLFWDTYDLGSVGQRGTLAVKGQLLSTTIFTANSSIMAVGYNNGPVALYDVSDVDHPRQLHVVRGDMKSFVQTLALRAGDKLIAAASADGDGPVALVDISDPTSAKIVGTFASGSPVDSMAFLPDGHTLITGDEQGRIALWDVADPAHPKLMTDLDQPDDRSSPLALSRDGKTLAVATKAGFALWDLSDITSPRFVTKVNAGNQFMRAMAIGLDGQTLITGDLGGTLSFWRLEFS